MLKKIVFAILHKKLRTLNGHIVWFTITVVRLVFDKRRIEYNIVKIQHVRHPIMSE